MGRKQVVKSDDGGGVAWTPFATIAHWGRKLGCHRNTLAKHLRSGAVRHRRLGRLVSIDAALLPVPVRG